MYESIDAQSDADGDDLGDSSHLEEKLAVTDEEEVPDTIIRLREIITAMPTQWQRIYQMVLIDGFSKAKTGRIIGISDVRVGQIVKKINAKIAADEELKKLFH